MLLTRVKVHNVLGIKDVDFNLEGHNVWLIGGANRSGKSSALKAIAMAVCGKRGQDYPDQPLHEGEKNGWVKLWTDNKLLIERKYTRKGNTVTDQLRVLDATGQSIKQPQTILTKLFKTVGFDPLAFSKLDPEAQLKQLKEMVEVDTTNIDEKLTETFDNRKVVSRLIRETIGFVAPDIPDDTPSEHVDVTKLTDAIGEIQKHNDSYRRLEQVLAESRVLIDRNKIELNAADDHIGDLNKRLSEVEKLRLSLAEKREHLLCAGESQSNTLEASSLKDDADIKKQIRETSVINRNVDRRAEYNRHLSKLAERTSEVDSLTESITRLREEKTKLFENARWPVVGLSYNESGVTFKGRPFSQSSYSESVDVSIEMGIAMNPDLRVFVIQHGESFDDLTLARIEAKAIETNFQFLIEFVTKNKGDEERCQVILENGSVKKSKDELMEEEGVGPKNMEVDGYGVNDG